MILQALKEYYDRKAADPASGIAPDGWEWRNFDFLAVIEEDGSFFGFQDIREGDDKKKRGRQCLVPALGEKKGNGIKANLLWENAEYMFGIPVPTKAKPEPDEKRVLLQNQEFRRKVRAVGGECAALTAAKAFARRDDTAAAATRDPLWQELAGSNPFLLLSLRAKGPLTDNPDLRAALASSHREDATGTRGICLATGVESKMANLEPPIKGVRGAQSTGASLVSFNFGAVESFGKTQGANAPIGKPASFAYATALNHLLRRDSPQRIQIGDATTVFWASRDSQLEALGLIRK